MERNRATTLATLAIIISMLLVPMPAMATHNSFGGTVDIVSPDEIVSGADVDPSEQGTIVPDTEGEYRHGHYKHLEDTPPLTERLVPEDQTGDRYRADECKTWSEYQAEFGEDTSEAHAAYEAGLDDGEACYIGFFDAQHEYMLATNLFLTKQPSSFFGMYAFNPTQNDAYCRGEQDPGDRGVAVPGEVPENGTIEEQVNSPIVGEESAVDQTVTSAIRTQDPECQGDGHQQNIPGAFNIDIDLLEDPAGSTAGEAMGTDRGSGTITLPLLSTPFLFIFGEPHPTNENPSDLRAGEGVFGPLSAEGGSPLWDLTGACGTGENDNQRTRDCRLLQPNDIRRYDQNAPDVQDEQARVCALSHQISIANPDQRDAGLCGVFGNVVNQFIGNATLGGFGTDAPTWVNTVPGWHQGIIFTPVVEDQAFEAADQYVRDPAEGNVDPVVFPFYDIDNGLPVVTNDTDGEIDAGTILIYAVNPKVPEPEHPLWCVRPNMLAEGDDALVNSAFEFEAEDPGLYGDYIADAIDRDVYPTPPAGLYEDLLDETHAPARDTIESTGIETLADEITDDADFEDPVPDPVTFVESEDTSEHNQPKEDVNQRFFEQTTDPGLACTPGGQVQALQDSFTQKGGLLFDVDVVHTQGGATVAPLGIPVAGVDGQNPRDPTAGLSEAPVGESETKEGHWNPELYTFGGSILGVIDSNGNGEFDECTLATGQPQPERDFCPFRALWDAYNPECTSFAGEPCGNLSRSLGYDTEKGMGLFFTLNVTGPVAVIDEDLARQEEIQERTRVVGADGSPGDQHCFIGISRGFGEHLAGMIGDDRDERFGQTENDTTFDDDDRAALCPDQASGDTTGEIVVIRDAFDDQSGTNRGGFSAAIDFAKLLPTPQALRDDAGTGFGDGDNLCVNGIWNVQEGGVTDDTDGTLDLGAEPGPNTYRFNDCDSFETGLNDAS